MELVFMILDVFSESATENIISYLVPVAGFMTQAEQKRI
jgi:hypothetical protein